ncbi:amino acid ABC transporter substrate-binding protein [Labedella phragmitis]|uniref:Amino acid ABC transporter substrate-binding protein n=1 Tax=Labedella phragmitis TaxID=2498849 RepID=A0A3S3Z2M8_9MICO|nr:ABC transporter substrate-binding protein [Labedella phragmitis]RWZ46419.1 amino acid ABC transporter substrate-binding protein [Labedella phragmitis]
MPRVRRSTVPLVVAVIGVALLSGCASAGGSHGGASSGGDSGYITDGKLTIATGEPAYFPWVIDDAPETGEGFEAAVAYAIADQLGFDEDDVVWVRSSFEASIAPGPKDFDLNLQQFSITPEREEAVDFSSPYYATTQTVITTGSSAAADAASIADLSGLIVGAQTGTTSFTAAEEIIAPTGGVSAFNSNEDAKAALEAGQIDALVVDLPTAFYMTGAELDDGVIIGQLPQTDGEGDAFGIVLPKDSALTDEVTDAVDALREDGTLDELAAEWLGGDDTAPVLE